MRFAAEESVERLAFSKLRFPAPSSPLGPIKWLKKGSIWKQKQNVTKKKSTWHRQITERINKQEKRIREKKMKRKSTNG